MQIQDVDAEFESTHEEFDYEEVVDTELVTRDDGENLLCILQKLLLSSKA